MYDKNHPSSSRRSGDEFLRRLMGGEIPQKASPSVANAAPASQSDSKFRFDAACASNGDAPSGYPYPPKDAFMPSLAMVYAPSQAWRCLYSPSAALSSGTLFGELEKPFEGRTVYRRPR